MLPLILMCPSCSVVPFFGLNYLVQVSYSESWICRTPMHELPISESWICRMPCWLFLFWLKLFGHQLFHFCLKLFALLYFFLPLTGLVFLNLKRPPSTHLLSYVFDDGPLLLFPMSMDLFCLCIEFKFFSLPGKSKHVSMHCVTDVFSFYNCVPIVHCATDLFSF